MRLSRGPVHGVTALGNRLFIIRQACKQHLEVYDSAIFKLETCLYIPGLREGPYGLTSCSITNCVYVSDFDQVHTVKLSADGRSHTVIKWSVAYGRPLGLHVNSVTGNLLVTCRGKPDSRLLEYTTGASPTLVREISLPSNITEPLHAVQLTYGLTVVVHGGWSEPGGIHRLCTVDDDGTVLYSHSLKSSLTSDDKDEPGQLAVVADGSFIVADWPNSRILVMGPSLSRWEELLLRVEGGLRRPYALCLDEPQGRLYVGEFSGDGRVLVFDNMIDIGNGGV